MKSPVLGESQSDSVSLSHWWYREAFSAGDKTGPRVQTSAGACPAPPPSFYLPFETPQSPRSLCFSTTLKGHTLLVSTHNARQQDKLLHKVQSPLPHSSNTRAHTHVHTVTRDPDRKHPKVFQPFLSTRKSKMQGLWKLHPLPQLRTNLNVKMFLAEVKWVLLHV